MNDHLARKGISPESHGNVNFLPAASPVEVIRQTRNQAVFDLARKVPGPPNLGQWLASAYFDALDQKLNRRSPLTRSAQLQRVAGIASQTSPQEMSTALAMLMTRGQNGAKEHLERAAVMKALTAKVQER